MQQYGIRSGALIASLTEKTAEFVDVSFIAGFNVFPRCSWLVPLLLRLDCRLYYCSIHSASWGENCNENTL